MTATVVRRPDSAVTAEPAARQSTRAPLSALVALLPVAAAFAIGYYRLDARSMWNDELVTWHATTLSVGEFRMLIGNIDLVHSFYYLLVSAVASVAGDSPTGLRLLSVVAIALTAGVVTLIGRRLFDWPVGVVAGLAFALLPSVSRYAQEARSYALVTLAAAVATWLFLRAADQPSRARWWAYGVALVLVGWLHFVALLVVAAHLVYVWRSVPGEVPRWRWVATTGFASLFVLPLVVLAKQQSGQISWVKNDLTAVQKFATAMTGTNEILAMAVVLSVLGVLFAGRAARPATLMLLVWAVVPSVVGYLTSSWLHLFLARYFLFTLPAFALLMAFGVVRVFRLMTVGRLPGVWVVGAAALLPLLVYLGLPAQQNVRSDDADGQPHYAAAVDYVAARAQPVDGVAFNDGFGGQSDIARKATDYGLRDRPRPRDVFLRSPARASGWLTAKECRDPAPCLGDTRRIWLIETGHHEDSLAGLPEAKAELFRQQFSVKHIERFERVRVVLLERQPAG